MSVGSYHQSKISLEHEEYVPPRNYPETYTVAQRIVVRDGSSIYFHQRGVVTGTVGGTYFKVRIDGMRIGQSTRFQAYQLADCTLGPTVDYSNGFGAILGE